MSPNDKLKILGMSNDQLAQGVAKLVKTILDTKAEKCDPADEAIRLIVGDSNSLLLEDSTPITQD